MTLPYRFCAAKRPPEIPGGRRPSARRFVVFLLTSAFAFSLGCVEQNTEATTATSTSVRQPYAVPLRSEAELANELQNLCTKAEASERGLALVEFSASWCSDCQKLHGMKQTSPLSETLDALPHLTVNVGRFDQHRSLLDALQIEKIAHWSIFAPTNCTEPITRWTRLSRRTLEVSSGAARNLSPADLAAWLASLRKS